MVYTERTERCIEPTNNSSNNSGSGKTHAAASKYSTRNYCTSSSNGDSKQSSTEDKWKYNNMVRNDREKFNNLHFC